MVVASIHAINAFAGIIEVIITAGSKLVAAPIIALAITPFAEAIRHR